MFLLIYRIIPKTCTFACQYIYLRISRCVHSPTKISIFTYPALSSNHLTYLHSTFTPPRKNPDNWLVLLNQLFFPELRRTFAVAEPTLLNLQAENMVSFRCHLNKTPFKIAYSLSTMLPTIKRMLIIVVCRDMKFGPSENVGAREPSERASLPAVNMTQYI